VNVSLTPELERFVREKVATGLYNNASEVVREALRAMHAGAPAKRPPSRDDIVRAIRRIEPELRAEGVGALFLFGSVARDEATEKSDVDVLIDAAPARRFSLLDQAGVRNRLVEALGREVDVVMRSALRKELRPAALRDALRVF